MSLSSDTAAEDWPFPDRFSGRTGGSEAPLGSRHIPGKAAGTSNAARLPFDWHLPSDRWTAKRSRRPGRDGHQVRRGDGNVPAHSWHKGGRLKTEAQSVRSSFGRSSTRFSRPIWRATAAVCRGTCSSPLHTSRAIGRSPTSEIFSTGLPCGRASWHP